MTIECIVINVEKIRQAFPNLTKDFYDILCERLKAHNFTDEELSDAVNHVIDTCKYPTPTIAEFISFIKEQSCPCGFKFGQDFGQYVGCEDICYEDHRKTWSKCRIAYRNKNK